MAQYLPVELTSPDLPLLLNVDHQRDVYVAIRSTVVNGPRSVLGFYRSARYGFRRIRLAPGPTFNALLYLITPLGQFYVNGTGRPLR